MGKNKNEAKAEELIRASETEVVEKKRALSYFALDGNYGDASGLTVIETTHWSEVDWAILDAASDWHRPDVARLIAESYEEETQLPLDQLKEAFRKFDIELDEFLPVG